MKILLFIASFTIVSLCSAQCGYGSNYKPTDINVGFILDWSLKQYEPSGFYGLGAGVGMWVDPHSTVVPALGIFAGYIESKLSPQTPATASGAVTLAIRYSFMEDRLATSAFFAAGTHNYQDYGLRVGYDIWNNGIAIGAMASRTMHYGLSLMITMKN